jgi:hypothetical protein
MRPAEEEEDAWKEREKLTRQQRVQVFADAVSRRAWRGITLRRGGTAKATAKKVSIKGGQRRMVQTHGEEDGETKASEARETVSARGTAMR